MEPLALTPADLARALEVLGPNLEHWRNEIRDGFTRTPRDDEPYDPFVDGPMLEGGRVLVGRRHLDRVLIALSDMERKATPAAYSPTVAALDAVKTAIHLLEGDA